jgi:hypothetical protein
MTQEVTLALVLAVLQVLALRIFQRALPQLYFTAGSLFVQRSEVTVGAILFRLAIPFSAGLVVPLLVQENELWVAAASGALAWFLVVWPILWSPDIMLPGERRGWIAVLLGAFWVAFAFLPVLGATLTGWIQSVVSDSDAEWWRTAIAQELILLLPVSLGWALLVRVARRRVTFSHEEPRADLSEEVDWPMEEEESDSRRWFEPAPWHMSVVLLAIVLLPVVLVAILVAIISRGRK